MVYACLLLRQRAAVAAAPAVNSFRSVIDAIKGPGDPGTRAGQAILGAFGGVTQVSERVREHCIQ